MSNEENKNNNDIEFSQEYPSPEVPVVPGYFEGNTINGLLPGEVVYSYGYAFGYDAQTREILINTSYSLDETAKDPQFLKSRVGLERVHTTIGGKLVDGFIADFRHLEPGSLSLANESIVDDPTDEQALAAAQQRVADRGYRRLLAAVFLDPDGRPHFMGPQELEPEAKRLMSQVDVRVAALNGNSATVEAPEQSREEQAVARLVGHQVTESESLPPGGEGEK